MNKKLFPLMLFLTLSILAGQTNVSGIIYDGNWTSEGSPYILDGDLTIYGLAIGPGVTVMSNTEHDFEVHGQIQAAGTYQDSIYFKPMDGEDYWTGIYFVNSGLQSEFKYCVIEHAAEAGIACAMSPDLVLKNCRISYGMADGIRIGEDATAHISNSIINHNTQDGLDIEGTVHIANSLITYNGGDGVNYSGHGDLTNCTIAFNQEYGIDNNDNTGLFYFEILNSIIFFNNNDDDQIDGQYHNVSYCDVQNAYEGMGNQAFNPLFSELITFQLTAISACIDNGHPGENYEDDCMDVSEGEARNDMGTYGGPYACSWLEFVFGCSDPNACNYNPTVTDDDGSCLFDDCNNECGGTAYNDDCGECVGGSTEMEENWALDECGICFGGNLDQDCAGVCFGESLLDGCGVCDADPENDNLTCAGCMDPDALNYDPDALFEDDSCEYQEITINIPTILGQPGDTLLLPIEITVPYSMPIFSCSMAIVCPDSGFVVTDVTMGEEPENLDWIMEFNTDECPVEIWTTGAQSMGGTHVLMTVEVVLTTIENSVFVPVDFAYLQFDENWYWINYEDGGADIKVPAFGDVSLNGVISAYDGALVLQYLVDQVEFEIQQELNAEVSGDETISAWDASLILQYGVGLITEFPAESEPFALVAEGDMYLEDQIVDSGSDFLLPIWLENGDNIYSFEFELEYNNAHLTFTGIESGTNIEDFTVSINESDGLIQLAGASAYPDGQAGIFLNLEFAVEGLEEFHTTQINFNRLRLNENDPVYNTSFSSLLNQTVSMGDLNQDFQMDVLDIVTIVSIIMGVVDGTDYQYFAGDFNQDGALDILDIVQMVSIIMGSDLSRTARPVNRAAVTNDSQNINITADNGNIAGVQLTVNGDFSIESNIEGWQIEYNEQTILLYTLEDVSAKSLSLDYIGELTITEAVIADWHGNSATADLQITAEEFQLGGAYPNPFNPVTQFSYYLPTDARLHIAVYDMLGRQVADLANGYFAAGEYNAQWDGTEQASGIYLIRMTANDFTQSSKIMLIK